MNNNEETNEQAERVTVNPHFTDRDSNREAFAKRLRSCIPEGMSQQKAADTLGVSVSGLKKWISGTAEPSVAYLPAFSAFTGRSVQWLVTGEESAQSLAGEGLDPELMQLVISLLCEHLQTKKVWSDVKPDDIAKLSLVLYRLMQNEANNGRKRVNLEEYSDIIKVILG